MKELSQAVVTVIPFLQGYPRWVHWLVAAWVIASAVLIVVLIVVQRLEQEAKTVKDNHSLQQTIDASSGGNTTVYQAGRDILVSGPQSSPTQNVRLTALTVEARLTAEIKSGAELPPGEVEFWPVGDAHAYLEGPGGRVRLAFQSPVRFRPVDRDRLVVINKFVMEGGAHLMGSPVEALRNYSALSVPIVTVVWGKSLARMRVLEIHLSANNGDPIYASYGYDDPFQEGPRFSVPLAPFHAKMFERR